VITELTEIETEEVSLVTRGANRKRFAFHKQEKPMSKLTEEQKSKLMKALAAATPAAMQKALNALELKKGLSDMADGSKAKVIQAIKLLASIGSDLPEGLMDDLIEALGVQSTSDLLAAMEGGSGAATEDPGTVAAEDPAAEPSPEEPMSTTKSETVKKSELTDAAKSAIAKAEKTAADATAQVETLRKQAAEGEKARTELAKQVAVERDARLTREFITKAETKMQHLPTPASELGPILKELSEKAPEAYAKLEKVLEGANEKAKTSAALLKEIGKGGNGGESADTAMAQLKKHAAEIRKAEPKLTEAQAFSQATQRNPELYAQYEREQKEGVA
jgi:hypothetical protein